MTFRSLDTQDLPERAGSPSLVIHRRARSDPTDFMGPLRSQLGVARGGEAVGGAAAAAADRPIASMTSSLPGLSLPGLSLPAGTDLDSDGTFTSTKPNFSKKDVEMWTVDEDLLILNLVERHGKRWSKIASHLAGRTDNGVRNR